MDFRSLQYIIAIARYQNITRAAEALYVGQPTLSKFLISTEKKLGVKLFRKLGNRYVLTFAGEQYVEKASQILRLKEDLDAQISDIVMQERGVLNIAFANMRCSYLLPATLPAFSAMHPNVKVNVFEGSSDENDRRLLDGQVDAAFYSMPGEENPMIEYHPIAREELLICTCKGHPLAARAIQTPDSRYPRLELSDLVGELVLLMRPQQRTRQIMDIILKKNHIQYPNVLYTSNIQAIMGLAAEGYGVSFVFDTHLEHRPASCLLDCYSFGQPRTMHSFVAASRKGAYLTRYVKDYIEIVKQSVAQKNKAL